MNKQAVLNFCRQFQYGTLATVSQEGNPEASTIEYALSDDFELIFDTMEDYRKCLNLKSNPKVAFVFGWDNTRTVQYEGVARELSGDELTKYQQIYIKHHPNVKKWMHEEGIVFYAVQPAWIRYADWNKFPPQTNEFEF
ncbi:MAG: pyridoxamine 5'-phosphate oxidase family protein [Candidatus Saccharimonadales bacterium]|nr:pyridoxamine 5'-phosphate oxidase family protein [Candidatus Saccharimonadales bacterium]